MKLSNVTNLSNAMDSLSLSTFKALVNNQLDYIRTLISMIDSETDKDNFRKYAEALLNLLAEKYFSSVKDINVFNLDIDEDLEELVVYVYMESSLSIGDMYKIPINSTPINTYEEDGQYKCKLEPKKVAIEIDEDLNYDIYVTGDFYIDSSEQTYYIKITDFDDDINSKGDDNNG